MTVVFNSDQQRAVFADAKRLIDSGIDNELVLGFLRERDFNKLDSIKVLVAAAGLSIGDAKNLVHHSRAWRDTFDKDEEFHTSLLTAVRNLNLDQTS